MSEKAKYILTLKEDVLVPIDARRIKPDNFVGKTLNEVLNIEIREGRVKRKISELFDIDGPNTPPTDVNSIEIHIKGKGTEKIRFLGYKMSGGVIIVHGPIGPLAGYRMVNGQIIIHGYARSWLGAKMKNGMIEVFGNAGDFVGSKLQGEAPGKGMQKGMIVIHGNAGSNIGAGKKGGSIIIEGNAGNSVGAYMMGGSILVMKNCGRFTGLGMTRGRVVVGGKIDGILPSFYVDSLVPSVKVKGYKFDKPFMIFVGDSLYNGMGMLQVSYEDNKELLSIYEELIKEVRL